MGKQWQFIRNRWVVFAHDLAWVPVALYLAYWLRFNLGIIPDDFMLGRNQLILLAIPLHGLSFWLFGCYRGLWRFASIPDLIRLVWAIGLGALATTLAAVLYSRLEGVPRSVLVLYPFVLMAGVAGARVAYRAMKDQSLRFDAANRQRALIVGAGRGGEILIRDLLNNGPFFPAAAVDDNSSKHGIELHGVRVRGNIDDIPRLIESFDINAVLIAMPSASRETMNRIVSMCVEAGVVCRTLPSIQELADGTVEASRLRPVTVEDLLGREPVVLDEVLINQFLENKRVLVTGGGGSIGSELCRQIAEHHPAQLVVLDNSEYNLYQLEREFYMDQPRFDIRFVVGDVRSKSSIDAVMRNLKPHVIFHAAAYKHVPMVEMNPAEGVMNNVFGTRVVADSAVEHHVDTFVLISTDKTVNPTNIMGATKRVAELYCQNIICESDTMFVTTRFGNVLASAGSVVPLFREQIEKGGPVTVTHPDVTRYFMTMDEAASLILQAGAMGKGCDIYVLDMGEPIRIQDLAEKMIRLSGMQPHEDVKVEYIGLRPGEKLHEELFYAEEELKGTPHPQLMLASGYTVKWDWLQQELSRLRDAAEAADSKRISAILKALVPEFEPASIRRSTDQGDKPDLRIIK